MKNYSFCFNRTISDIFSQNALLGLLINPSTIHVLSPSNDKYLGAFTLVRFHAILKFDEFGFLKTKLN